MAYKYREDEGLEFLADVPGADLGDLVSLLIESRNEQLTKTDKYKLHKPDHNKYWKEVATDIQTFGGNTFSNIYRGEGTVYREILCDVCDRMKVNYNKGSRIERIEMNLMMKVLEDTFEEMTPDQKVEILKSMGGVSPGWRL